MMYADTSLTLETSGLVLEMWYLSKYTQSDVRSWENVAVSFAGFFFTLVSCLSGFCLGVIIDLSDEG